MFKEKFRPGNVVTDHDTVFNRPDRTRALYLKILCFTQSPSARFRMCIQSVLLLLNEGEGPVETDDRHYTSYTQAEI